MTPDYDRIIDAETWAFIERTNSFYPEDAATRSVAEQRAIYDRMCAAFRVERPQGVAVTDGRVRDIPVRHYSAGGRAAHVLFCHGGGFVVGGLDSHDDLCAEICTRTGFDVTAVDYRLAPEYHFPADFNDVHAVWEGLSTRWAGRIVLVGDSAGGALCAGLSQALRRAARKPDGQVLIYPGLGFQADSRSMEVHGAAPMLTREDCLYYRDLRVGGDMDLLANPRCSPLRATDFAGLPPTHVFAAECDPLADEARAYAEAIAAAGGQARNTCEAGLVHGYLRARHTAARATDSFARIVAAVAELGVEGRFAEG